MVDRDRQTDNQASEVIVTAMMVDAGARSGLIPFGMEGVASEVVTVSEMYVAMRAAMPRAVET